MKRTTERQSAGAQHRVPKWLSCLVIALPMGAAYADIVTDRNEKLMAVHVAAPVGFFDLICDLPGTWQRSCRSTEGERHED